MPRNLPRLPDIALKRLKAKDKIYKVTARDGMYVVVSTSGLLTFRYDCRMNGRRETLTLGKYGPDGIGLAEAREQCVAARKMVAEGQSPALEKQREKRRQKLASTFGEIGLVWFREATMAASTRGMRRGIFDRDILPAWKNRLLVEISPNDLRALCNKAKRGGSKSPTRALWEARVGKPVSHLS